MALGQVQINNLNLMQGPINEIERHLLFVGKGVGKNDDTVLTVTTDTELDDVLGNDASTLKTQLNAAKVNAGQNWIATVVPLKDGTTWQAGVDLAMKSTNVEGVVLTDPVSAVDDVTEAQTKAEEIMGEYFRPLFFILTTAELDKENQTWSQWSALVKNLVSDVAAPNVSVVPALYSDIQGAYAGRLCDRSVTVADSPIRVQTGGLIGNYGSKPTDSNEDELTMGILTDLALARLSVPQWYASTPGLYWGDGAMLDVPGGDYQVIENLRVVPQSHASCIPTGRLSHW